MQQHLQRQDGVAKVEVSLLKGTAEVTPKEDGRLDPVKLLKAVYDSGVTVAEMDMTARGRLVKGPSGTLVFQVAPNESFEIVPNDVSKNLEPLASGPAQITLRGVLYKKPQGKKKEKVAAPLRFEILEVLGKE